MTDAWGLLGIEPTGDLKAIRKAYAARLKHTRPDDDAAAYQALREAYEAAQQQAYRMGPAEQPAQAPRAGAAPAAPQGPAVWSWSMQWRQDAGGGQGDAPPPEPAPPPLPQPSPDAPEWRAPGQRAIWFRQPRRNARAEQEKARASEPAPPPAEPEAPPWRAPDELAAWFEQRLSTRDAGALAADWRAVERALDALPLSMQAAASRCFADMLIKVCRGPLSAKITQRYPADAFDLPIFPTTIGNALLHRFGWLSDFRADQILGAQRAHVLRTLLGDTLNQANAGQLQSARKSGDDAAFVPDQVFLDRYRAVAAFAQGVQSLKGGWRQWLYILLTSSRLRQLWMQLQPAQRHALGADKELEPRINLALKWTHWPRFALLAALGASMAGGLAHWPAEWWIALCFLAAGQFLNQFIYRWIVKNTLFGRVGGAMWRDIPVKTLVAVGCQIVALAGVVFIENRDWFLRLLAPETLSICILAIGILLGLSWLLSGWPRARADIATPAVLLLCVQAGQSVVVPWVNMPWSGAVAGALWFMLNLLAHDYRAQWIETHWGLRWKRPQRLLVRLTLGWPYTVMLWSGRHAPNPALAGCGLALLTVLLPALLGHYERFSLLFPLWVVCTLAAYGLDRAFAFCAQSFVAQPRKGALQLLALLGWVVWVVAYLYSPECFIPSWLGTIGRFERAWLHLVMAGLLPVFVIATGVELAGRSRRLKAWLSGR